MINYVNNSFDKVLKPCDAQKFMELTQSEQTEKLILGHRAGEKNSKAKLPALTYMGVLDEPRYKAYLAQCEEQGTQPLGSRRAEFMRPTGLLMLDFDHISEASPSPSQGGVTLTTSAIDSPVKLWEYIKSFLTSHPSLGRRDVKASVATAETLVSQRSPAEQVLGGGLNAIALAHITPSGDGLRLVLKRTKGMSIQQEQYEFCKAMGVTCDDVCKDISRLSFAPMQKEILYYNPSLLFGELPNAEDYPNNDFFGQSVTPSPYGYSPLKRESAESAKGVIKEHCPSLRGTSAESGANGAEGVTEYPTDYNGIEYSVVVERLEEQLGGKPERGARNSFIFTMACNLRYICDDNADWVASILPTYGEEAQKHRQTIQSAINRPMSKAMPETLARALNIAKLCSEVDSKPSPFGGSGEGAPPMPSVLPAPIALLTSRTPDKMKAAVAMGVFPSLGAYVKGLHLVYADGRHYEPTFMNVLVAEQSAGKSAVNTPVDYILADMKVRDEVHLHQEMEWKDKCARISNTQDKPARPKGLVVQILPSDMTNAAFVQRLADAEGHFLYTRMDEVELLNALKTNGASNMVSAVLRLAFDCGEYGQVRVAANAINAMVRVRWNWNASSTVQRVRKYFAKNIADGTLSRLSFATILEDDEDWGEEMPVYEEYGTHFADDLLRYIDRLKTSAGVLRCPEAVAWAVALNRELVGFAREADDRSYARLSRRGILMGFFRAMLLYVMNGMQWSEEIEAFATWSVKYDLWCKMRFFRDMLHSDIEGERTALQRGPVGLLSMLPKEFTRDDVKALRIAQGMKPDPKECIKNWLKRGHVISVDSRGLYVKAEGSGSGVN